MKFYKETKTELRTAIFTALPFLEKEKMLRLEKLWKEYDGTDTQVAFEMGYEGGTGGMTAEIKPLEGKPMGWNRLDKLNEFFDRFSKAVD